MYIAEPVQFFESRQDLEQGVQIDVAGQPVALDLDAEGLLGQRHEEPGWIFVQIVFPLGKPAIASLGIFQFLWVWNDMLIALVFANTENQPMTKALQSQMRQFGTNIDILSSGAFLSLIIPLILFFAFQRYFVQGMMAGSVK